MAATRFSADDKAPIEPSVIMLMLATRLTYKGNIKQLNRSLWIVANCWQLVDLIKSVKWQTLENRQFHWKLTSSITQNNYRALSRFTMIGSALLHQSIGIVTWNATGANIDIDRNNRSLAAALPGSSDCPRDQDFGKDGTCSTAVQCHGCSTSGSIISLNLLFLG